MHSSAQYTAAKVGNSAPSFDLTTLRTQHRDPDALNLAVAMAIHAARSSRLFMNLSVSDRLERIAAAEKFIAQNPAQDALPSARQTGGGGDAASADCSKLRVLDLFSGLGAFTLGLERAGGFQTVAFSEIDKYASGILARQYPNVPNIGDVTTADFPDADVICAGFPCQDLSSAGKRAGLAGQRSGLWREVVRAIRLVRPRLVLLENVAALLNRGMGTVCGDLAANGLDAEWDCIPASHVGAPHARDRIWFVAYPERRERRPQPYLWKVGRMGREQQSVPWDRDWQVALREFRRVDDGTAYRVDRIDTLRNAVVPQIPELIGRAILAAHRAAPIAELAA